MNRQLSLDDIIVQNEVATITDRIAFIDECGSFGFDFSKKGTSEYYLICAVIVEKEDIKDLQKKFYEIKKTNGFEKTEIKSSKIGNNDNQRTRIINMLLPIKFKVILLIADKKKFIENSPLTEYKPTFIKYLHRLLYESLYNVYPKLKIIEDEVGTTEFQKSFKKYVENNRPEINLFNDYDFEYTDSKEENLVQLADLVGGTIYKNIENPELNWYEILKGKILAVHRFPNSEEPFWGKVSPEDYKFNKDIYSLSLKCANDFILKNSKSQITSIMMQVAFLRNLLYEVNINPIKYISSKEAIYKIKEFTGLKCTKNQLFRHVVAPLRDSKVILASCNKGYKIPISIDDITMYLNQTHTVVEPMLHRMEVCRNLIIQATKGELDILNDIVFTKYKKYFD